MAQSSEDKVLAGVSHLGVLIGWAGLVMALVIYLLRKDHSVFIKRSVKQAMGFQICVLVVIQLLGFIFGGSVVLGILSSKVASASSLSFSLIKTINLLLFALGIWGAAKNFLGNYFRYPVIGKFIERI